MKNSQKSAFSLLEASIVVLVVGVIIAGVVTGSKLISESRLKSARALAQAAGISGIDGLVLWIDSTAENVITNTSDSYKISNGQAVKTIKDASSENIGITFSEISSGTGPTYIKSGINSLPTMYFNGSSNGNTGNCLQTPYSIKLDPVNLSFFIVTMQLGEVINNGVTLYDNFNASSNGKFRVFINNYSSAGYINVNLGDILPSVDSSTEIVTLKKPYVFSFTHSEPPFTTNPTSKFYKQGVLSYTDTDAHHAVNDISDSSSYVNFGCRLYAGSHSEHYNGYISEIILFNRVLSDDERSVIEGYLIKKYGLKV